MSFPVEKIIIENSPSTVQQNQVGLIEGKYFDYLRPGP